MKAFLFLISTSATLSGGWKGLFGQIVANCSLNACTIKSKFCMHLFLRALHDELIW